MLNIERYKEEIIDDIDKRLNSIYGAVYRLLETLDIHFSEDDDTYDRRIAMINWLCEEYKEPILNDVEKEYLSNVIKPFKDKVISICKCHAIDNEYCIVIYYDGDGKDIMEFPSFELNTAYRGMKIDKEYTLEELGL